MTRRIRRSPSSLVRISGVLAALLSDVRAIVACVSSEESAVVPAIKPMVIANTPRVPDVAAKRMSSPERVFP